MMNTKRNSSIVCFLGLACFLAFAASPSRAQVSPFEIRNAKLKTAEETYLRKLMDLNQAISDLKFPYSFVLSRYAGLDPKDQIGSDTRGIEFVNFHDRVVLKITGNYNAAFSSSLLTKNQRSDRVFQEVVAPVLRLLPAYFKAGDEFDDVGLEICYHVLAKTNHYEYEGREILAVVLDKNRALSFSSLPQGEAQQESLNQSDVYLNGKPFGLALGQSEPMDLEAIGRHRPAEKPHPVEETKIATLSKDDAVARSAWEERSVDAIFRPSAPPTVSTASSASGPARGRTAPANGRVSDNSTAGSVSKADVDALQSQYQSRLDAFASEGAAKYHLVDYAPPSFVLFRGQAYLQITLRGPEKFDQDSTSIYKRTARTFDLFLAPELKALLAQIPQDTAIAGLDITVLDQVESHASASASKTGAMSQAKSQTSEAIEFICPLNLLERFADAEITNQQLIDGSIVLVNGVRIGLNLQQVE